MDYWIGLDIGGTRMKSVCVARGGEVLAQAACPTPDSSDPAAWSRAVHKHLVGTQTAQRCLAQRIGLAAPGLAAADGRSIAWMQGRLDVVEGLDWSSVIEAEYTVPVLNDAHAALLGEAWVGAAAGATNAILLTLGTGVGGAVLSDGHLLRGHMGRAGHLGHVSLDPDGAPDLVGTPGSLEDAIGECSLPIRSDGRFRTTQELLAARRAGDALAREVWDRSLRALAAAIASLINVVDPEVVILGGGIAAGGPELFDPLGPLLDRWEWRPHGRRVSVVSAKLGDLAGALGAARRAMEDE